LNPFIQRIGIYYKDSYWADNICTSIINDAADSIDQSRGVTILSKYTKRITFKDGSIVEFVPVTESSRGKKFTKSFIQNGISKEIFYTVIAPYTLWGECWIVKDYEGLFPHGKHFRANRYYRSLELPEDNEKIFKQEYECVWNKEKENS